MSKDEAECVKNKMCAKLGLYVLSFLLLMASSEDTDSLDD